MKIAVRFNIVIEDTDVERWGLSSGLDGAKSRVDLAGEVSKQIEDMCESFGTLSGLIVSIEKGVVGGNI